MKIAKIIVKQALLIIMLLLGITLSNNALAMNNAFWTVSLGYCSSECQPNLGSGTNVCALPSANSTYFSPKVRIIRQVCGLGICGCDEGEFAGYGECNWLMDIRYCARPAPPCTPCKDSQGKPTNDCCNGGNNLSANGAPSYGNTSTTRVRICGYEDSCDSADKDGCVINTRGYMPYHWHQPLTSSNNLGNSDLQAAAGGTLMASATVLTAAGMMALVPGIGQLMTAVTAVIGGAMALISGILTGIADINNALGLNQVVVSGSGTIGCVEIPAAPAPPPFPDFISGGAALTRSPAVVEKICAANEVSTAASPCVTSFNTANKNSAWTQISSWNSNLVNNDIAKNLVRVSFTNNVQFCQSTTDKNCVSIVYKNGESASDIHNKYKDILDSCVTNGSVTCLDFSKYIPQTFGPYRVVYQTAARTATNQLNYSYSGWFSYTNTTVSAPVPWGINDANYSDIKYTFLSSNSDGSGMSITMTDPGGNTRSFKTSYSASQPYQICIKETKGIVDEQVNCVARPTPPQASVSACDSSGSSICNSTVLSPKVVISLGDSNVPIQSGYVGVNNQNDTAPPPFTVKLYGLPFSAVATDDQLQQADSNGNLDKDSYYNPKSTTACFTGDPCNGGASGNLCCYIGGLRYKSNKYWSGATKICLAGNTINSPTILSKLTSCTTTSGITTCTGTASTLSTDIIKSPYTPGDSICYTGRQSPDCAQNSSTGQCCNSCPSSTSPCGTDATVVDLAKVLDFRTEGVRLQTAAEAGVCVAISQPQCAASTSGSLSEGYATWAATNAGQIATGTCISTYANSSAGAPTRSCYLSSSGAAWTNVTNSCVKARCAATNEMGATWPQTDVGQTATGTCNSGYSGTPPIRNCTTGTGNTTQWSSISSGCTQTTCPSKTFTYNWESCTDWGIFGTSCTTWCSRDCTCPVTPVGQTCSCNYSCGVLNSVSTSHTCGSNQQWN